MSQFPIWLSGLCPIRAISCSPLSPHSHAHSISHLISSIVSPVPVFLSRSASLSPCVEIHSERLLVTWLHPNVLTLSLLQPICASVSLVFASLWLRFLDCWHLFTITLFLGNWYWLIQTVCEKSFSWWQCVGFLPFLSLFGGRRWRLCQNINTWEHTWTINLLCPQTQQHYVKTPELAVFF